MTSHKNPACHCETRTRSMRYTSRTPEEAQAWQSGLRLKLFDLLKLADLASGAAPIPFHAQTFSSRKEDGYVAHEMELCATPGRRQSIVLTMPVVGKGPFPAIVLIAGHGGSRHTAYGDATGYHRIGHILAGGGYVTVSTEVGQHEVHEQGRSLAGERLWSLVRCVDFLASCPEVDAGRIGAAGKSLGGEMLMWLAALEPRVQASVVAGFLTRMDQMEANHCMCWKFPGLRELVDFADLYSLIAPRALLCQNGLDEPPSQFPPSVALDVLREIGVIYADLGASQNVTLVAHKGGHEFHVPSVLGFFERNLRPR